MTLTDEMVLGLVDDRWPPDPIDHPQQCAAYWSVLLSRLKTTYGADAWIRFVCMTSAIAMEAELAKFWRVEVPR